MLKDLYISLSTPELNGKTIGKFRIISAIFGGLLVSYSGMTLIAFLIPEEIKLSAIISILFNTIAWASVSLWIALSYTKLSALLKVIILSVLFLISLYFLY